MQEMFFFVTELSEICEFSASDLDIIFDIFFGSKIIRETLLCFAFSSKAKDFSA